MTETRYLFFTGKGGVGKTSVACATAINLAEQGKNVLLVSTDPASNLDDVLEVRIGPRPIEIPGIHNLQALNLDPEEAGRAYREQVVGSYRGILPDNVIASIEEQLSGACTVEVATFDLFSQLLADTGKIPEYDHVVFDTSPTGHSLRLLSLPKAWSDYISTNSLGTSAIGILAGLKGNRERYEKAVAVLSDPTLTTIVLVTKPDRPALIEAARASSELEELGLSNQQLVVNCVLQTSGDDPVAAAFKQQQRQALDQMPEQLKKINRRMLPFLPLSLVGIENLRALAEKMRRSVGETEANTEKAARMTGPAGDFPGHTILPPVNKGLRPIVDDLKRKERGIVLVMGKGGVGKTTVAAALALALAEDGRKVYLSTTDPAAHLDLFLNSAGDEKRGSLTVSRIDPAVEVATYRKEVLETVGAGLDQDGLALLKEDLATPCTEEIAVFRAFARTVGMVEEGFVVLDTAPTGHTLLLLDSTLSYHREVERNIKDMPEEVRRLLPRLRDHELTHVMLVTLPQATPVLEASRLQEDLRRAGIEPDWWILNQSFSGVPTADPVLRNLSLLESPWIDKVVKTLAKRAVCVPWQTKVPEGRDGLMQLI